MAPNPGKFWFGATTKYRDRRVWHAFSLKKMTMEIKIDPCLLNKVKGFLDEDEGRKLYEFAYKAGRLGPCLEIGSYCGKSTLYLGTACRENKSILFSIDHHRGSEEHQPGEEYFDPDLFDSKSGKYDTFRNFRNTIEMAALEETVVPIVCRSDIAARMWSTPLSLIFIDGGHSYETVSTDYHSWVKHVVAGGYLILHDIFEDPDKGGQAPYRVYQKAVRSGLFSEFSIIKTLGVLRRKNELKHR